MTTSAPSPSIPFTSLKDSAGVETRGAMPSGHTAAAFAVATSLADDIDNPIADVLLYIAAAGTALSRLNDNRHWLSDTIFGATLGVFTAKVVNGPVDGHLLARAGAASSARAAPPAVRSA